MERTAEGLLKGGRVVNCEFYGLLKRGHVVNCEFHGAHPQSGRSQASPLHFSDPSCCGRLSGPSRPSSQLDSYSLGTLSSHSTFITTYPETTRPQMQLTPLHIGPEAVETCGRRSRGSGRYLLLFCPSSSQALHPIPRFFAQLHDCDDQQFLESNLIQYTKP